SQFVCASHVRDVCCFDWPRDHLGLLSFPTRRSSDLGAADLIAGGRLQLGISRGSPEQVVDGWRHFGFEPLEGEGDGIMARRHAIDRKSTRLNSSHVKISYAVFCLKKKKKIRTSSDIL